MDMRSARQALEVAQCGDKALKVRLARCTFALGLSIQVNSRHLLPAGEQCWCRACLGGVDGAKVVVDQAERA